MGGGSGGGMGGGMGGGLGGSTGGYEGSQPYVESRKEERERNAPPANKGPSKGMVLGSKSKKSDFVKVLKEEKIVEKEEELEEIAAGGLSSFSFIVIFV